MLASTHQPACSTALGVRWPNEPEPTLMGVWTEMPRLKIVSVLGRACSQGSPWLLGTLGQSEHTC